MYFRNRFLLVFAAFLSLGVALAQTGNSRLGLAQEPEPIALPQAVVGQIGTDTVITVVTITNSTATDCRWGISTVDGPAILLINGSPFSESVNIPPGGVGKFVLEAGASLEGAEDFGVILNPPSTRPQCTAYALVVLKYVFLSPDGPAVDVYSYPASPAVGEGSCVELSFNTMTVGDESAPLPGVAVLTQAVPPGASFVVALFDMDGNLVGEPIEFEASSFQHQTFLLPDLLDDPGELDSNMGVARLCPNTPPEEAEDENEIAVVGIEVNLSDEGTQFGVLPQQTVSADCSPDQNHACGAGLEVAIACPGPGDRMAFISSVNTDFGPNEVLQFDFSCAGTSAVDASATIRRRGPSNDYSITLETRDGSPLMLDPETTFQITDSATGQTIELVSGEDFETPFPDVAVQVFEFGIP